MLNSAHPPPNIGVESLTLGTGIWEIGNYLFSEAWIVYCSCYIQQEKSHSTRRKNNKLFSDGLVSL